MSKATIDGKEPAFPIAIPEGVSQGMSLRTYIAAQVLQACVAELGEDVRGGNERALEMLRRGDDSIHHIVASTAVAFADALIAELNKPRTP